MNESTERSCLPQLHALIERRDLACCFQPLVDLTDGSIMGYEALSRPGLGSGFEDATAMFEAAAQHGLLWELESVTRSVSLEAAKGWPPHTRLFLNSSPDVFADPRFVSALTTAIAATHGLERDSLVLEITELSDDQHIPGLIEQVTHLRLAGFHVAIDDAGAGASGLVRMLALRPQWIKLDREFVQGIDVDLYRQNLVRFFVQFGRMSGVHLVAEGIETSEELSTVMGLGVRYGQGFALARPTDLRSAISEELAAQVRQRWRRAEASLPADPFNLPLARLACPAQELPRTTDPAEAARALARSAGAVGVLFRDGRRVCGFAWRHEIVQAAAGACPDPAAIERFCERPVCQIASRATIQEALQLACLIDEESVADPIVLISGQELAGVVRLRDVLRAAAHEGRLGHSWRAPVTGLPSRIQADQHLQDLIQRHKAAAPHGSGPARSLHADAAIVDIRRFDDYNTLVGYELGDKLIRDLADLIAGTVVSAIGDAFLAHLSDDRFLITAPAGALRPACERLAAAFDRFAAALPRLPRAHGCAPEHPAVGEPSPVGIRVLLMPRAIPAWTHPRDLYRTEASMRSTERRAGGPDAAGAPSVILEDRRSPERAGLRMSA